MNRLRGFLFTAEAALSLLLIIAAVSFLPLFSYSGGDEPQYALCADAAGSLMKQGAFESEEKLSQSVSRASSLSGMCISASLGEMRAGECSREDGRVSYSFPVLSKGEVKAAQVDCSLQ